jgi:hypothetical protein
MLVIKGTKVSNKNFLLLLMVVDVYGTMKVSCMKPFVVVDGGCFE